MEFLKYINSKESNGFLKSFKSMKVQSLIVHIHSMMSENDKTVHLIVHDFHMKRSRYVGYTKVFQKRRFQGFLSEFLRVVSLLEKLEKKFIFFNSLEAIKVQRFSNFLCIFLLSFS